MNILPVCFLYTQDADLARRVCAGLALVMTVKHVDDPACLESMLQPVDPTVLIFDLCGEQAQPLLGRVISQFPETVTIALGMARSDPALAVLQMGLFSVEEDDLDGRRLQSLVTQAHALRLLLQERRMLRQRLASAVTDPASRPPQERTIASRRPFARVFRHFGSVQSVLENVLESVTEFAKVTRAGLFTVGRDENVYRLRAAVKCLPIADAPIVPQEAPLARWLHLNAHLISRETLTRVTDPAEYLLLRQSLDALGAEVIIPLHGRERLIGWLFFGHHATGLPFDPAELEELALLADDLSLTIENALLYEEVAVQKTLAETVLHSIPVGIVAVDAENTVHWFNQTACRILEVPSESVLHQPAHRLDSRVADLLARCLKGESMPDPHEWIHPANLRILSTLARRLTNGEECLGAVAIIHDVTDERRMRKKQDQMERAAFWMELAAAISHEVRNPLVAISTFAQLLPERYRDEEFRNQFSELASREIHRLDSMVDQINAFANPPELMFEDADLAAILDDAVAAAGKQADARRVRIERSVEAALPLVRGDRLALTGCFVHLVRNAFEALVKTPVPVLRVRATLNDGGRAGKTIRVRIEDNGIGIPDDIRDKVFSPFCSTKARGIGLGLPIVQRTVADHNGSISIDTGNRGTIVTVTLPALDVSKSDDDGSDDETRAGG